MALDVQGDVVVIEDDEQCRLDLKSFLEQNGLTVIALENASSAMRFIQNQSWSWKPGLIITDLVMDGMGGYQLIRRLQELYRNQMPPVIVVSKLQSGTDVGEAEFAGASGYLTKPLNEEKLVDVIDKVISNSTQGMVVYTEARGLRIFDR